MMQLQLQSKSTVGIFKELLSTKTGTWHKCTFHVKSFTKFSTTIIYCISLVIVEKLLKKNTKIQLNLKILFGQ